MPVPAGMAQVQQAQGLSWGDPGQNEQQAIYFTSNGLVLDAGLIDKGGEVFNILAYGASALDSLNSIDQAPKIQAAINAAANKYRAASATGGGIVFVPPGLWYIGSPLIMSSNNVALVGAGPEITSIAAQGTFTGAAMVVASGSRQRISDLTLHGQSVAATCIQVNAGANNHYIHNCRLTSSTSQCVVYTDNTANSTYTIIEDCDLATTQPLTVACILMDPPTPPSIGGSQRSILKCTAAGGIIVDVNACNTLQVIGCSGNVTFSQTNGIATKCIFTSNRIPGATTVYGSNIVFVGNMTSNGFTLGTNSNSCALIGNSVGIPTVNNSVSSNTIIDAILLSSGPGLFDLNGPLKLPNLLANGVYARSSGGTSLLLTGVDINNNIVFGQHATAGTNTVIDTPTGQLIQFDVNGAEVARVTSEGSFRPISSGTLVAKVKAGPPVDGDFTTPIDGMIVVDSNNKLWARIGGVWKGVVVV